MQAKAARDAVKARRYLECSAITGDGMDELLEEVTRLGMEVRRPGEKSGCTIS